MIEKSNYLTFRGVNHRKISLCAFILESSKHYCGIIVAPDTRNFDLSVKYIFTLVAPGWSTGVVAQEQIYLHLELIDN